jgi:hypothetical protein
MDMLFVRGDGVILVRASFVDAYAPQFSTISGITAFADVISTRKTLILYAVCLCAPPGSEM